MKKPTDLRLNKKVVIPILILLGLLVGYLIYNSISFNQRKSRSVTMTEQAYQILHSDAGKKVILRVNGTDVTYGQLMSKAKIIRACSPNKNDVKDEEYTKEAFIDLAMNIAEAYEVKKWMTADKSASLTPESDEATQAYEKQVLKLQKAAHDPETAGVANVMYNHIADDLAYYKNKRLVYLWINQFSKSSLSTNASSDTSQKADSSTSRTQTEIKKLIVKCKEECKIEYVEKGYDYLNMSLIQI